MGTAVQGRLGTVDVSADGITYTALGGVKDFAMNTARGPIETTDFDSAGWKENLSGIGSATMDGSLNYEEDDAGQIILWTINMSGADIWIRWRPQGNTTGKYQFVVKSHLTALDQNQAFDGAAEMSMSAESNGAPVKSAVPAP